MKPARLQVIFTDTPRNILLPRRLGNYLGVKQGDIVEIGSAFPRQLIVRRADTTEERPEQ